jgi:gas vesicle protein
MASKFLAGALLGLVAGLLLAPDKGETTRANLVDSAGKWRDKLNNLTGGSELNLDDLRAYLERNIGGLSNDVKHRILTILDEHTDNVYTPKPHVGNGVA